MKMQKVNKYFNIFFILLLICIFISIILILAYSIFSGKIYVAVTDKNRDTIMNMLEKNGIVNSSEITINNEIVRIGKRQGLGDWYLYIKYNNGEEKSIILDDWDSEDLYKYIGSNGRYGETLGILTEISITISIIAIIFIPIYVTFKICYAINRITEKEIQKDKDK